MLAMKQDAMKQTSEPLEDNMFDIVLDLEASIDQLTALVERLLARSVATGDTVNRLEVRAKRTESRLCQFMQDQGSEIYMPPGEVS